MSANTLQLSLAGWGASDAVLSMVDDLLLMVPAGGKFEDDQWDCLEWRLIHDNAQTKIINFSVINHPDLKLLAKVRVLDSRLKRKAGIKSAMVCIVAMKGLSNVLGARLLRTLRTDDFELAQKQFARDFNPSTAHRYASGLATASTWLASLLQLPLDYQNTLPNIPVHGRHGTEAGRKAKLVSDRVLGDLLATRQTEGLSARDSFFVDALMVLVATGFRTTEWITLPEKCKLRTSAGLQILHFPRKGGRPIPRPIPSKLAGALEHALDAIRVVTAPARKALRDLAESRTLDWRRILRDPVASQYFVAQWASIWVADADHRIINPDGAWCNVTESFTDVLTPLKAAGGNQSLAARNMGITRRRLQEFVKDQLAARRGELPKYRNTCAKYNGRKRLDWDNDKRVISARRFRAHCGLTLKKAKIAGLQSIFDAAGSAQLRSEPFPAPLRDPELEEQFVWRSEAVVRTKDGVPLLMQHDALFVLPRYLFSDARSTRDVEPQSLDVSTVSRWMCGLPRSRGSGKPEESVFSRLNIVDEATGKTAKFTARDVRHWLNTLYQNGGLTDDQISLIFNRRNPQHTPVYDQTPNETRVERLKAAVRLELVAGRVSETYQMLVADYSREEAEQYLEAALRMVNPMPHGVCTLNWSTVPCPHQLSCFSCQTETPGPCEHLIVDPNDASQMAEVKRIRIEATLITDAIEGQGVSDSPQLGHFRRVLANTSALLGDALHGTASQ